MFELDSKYEIDGILVKKYVKSIDALTISTKKIKEVLNGVFIGEQDVLHWIEEYIADGLCEIKK